MVYSLCLLQIVARVRVGGRPVHAYAVNQTSTVWTHSDAEGSFYLVPANNSQNLTVARVVPVSHSDCLLPIFSLAKSLQIFCGVANNALLVRKEGSCLRQLCSITQ